MATWFPDENERRRGGGWYSVAPASGGTITLAVTAIAPMLTAVRDDLGVSRGAMGFALGAWALIYIVTAPLAGRFIDRIGLGWSLALGGLSVSGSLVLRAAAQGLGSLWLAIAFFGVFGP